MKVLVCGGRDFNDQKLVDKTLDAILTKHSITALAHGMSTGADHMAGIWGVRNGIPTEGYVADWAKYNRAAGPIRNQLMLDEFKPELVVAFPGGSGTADMVRRAHSAGVTVLEITGAS